MPDFAQGKKGRGWKARFVRFTSGSPLPPLGLALLIFSITAPGLLLLRSDFSHKGFFFEGDPRLVEYERFQELFGSDDTFVIGVESEKGKLDTVAWERVSAIATEASRIAGVGSVDAATRHVPVSVLEAAVPEALIGTLVSADRTLALVVGTLEGDPDAKQLSDALAKVVERNSEGVTCFRTGTPVITAAFETIASEDMGRLVPIAVASMVLLLLLLLRSLAATGATLIAIALGAVSALGVAGLCGIPINNLTLAVPQILLAIGTAGSVHIISSYRHARRFGRRSSEAMQEALTRNLRPMLLAGGTTAFGFLSLTISDLQPVATLGVVAGAGTLLVLAYTFLVVVPMVRVLAPYRGAKFARDDRWGARCVSLLVRAEPAILIGAACVTIFGGGLVRGVTIDSDPLRYFAPSVAVRRSTESIKAKFGGVRGIEIVIEDAEEERTQAALLSLCGSLESDPRVSRVFGAERGGTLSSSGWRSADGRTERLTVQWDRNNSKEVLAATERIEGEMAALGLHGFITGKTFLYQTVNEHIVRSFASSALVALVLIAAILIVALRSFRLGLLSLIPNVIPLIVGVACIRWLGRSLDIGGTVVASVCLGISVDDTIHMISGYRSARSRGLEAHDAMARTLERSGRALVTTSVVLVATFGGFALGEFVPNAMFGVMCAAVISAALVADLTLLPVLLLRSEPSVRGTITQRAKQRERRDSIGPPLHVDGPIPTERVAPFDSAIE